MNATNPRPLDPIFKPETRKPAPNAADVDLHKIFLAGTMLWVLALLATLLMRLMGAHVDAFLIIAGFGVLIGVLLMIWEKIDRPRYRKLAR